MNTEIMTRIKIIILGTAIVILPILFPSVAIAVEAIFPASYDVQAEYDIPADEITIGDTLIITRSVTNNEAFGLANLYLGDNLPLEFELLDYVLLIDNQVVPTYYSGPLEDNEIPSYNAYQWLIDLPTAEDSLNRILSAEETLTLQYRFICSQPGEYSLPFHTLCAYSDNSGVFTTAPPISLTILPANEIDHDGPDTPEDIFISRAYPNPFNSEVVICYDNKTLDYGLAHLVIYDLTGGIFYESFFSSTGIMHWRPSTNISSGIYFYRIYQASDKRIIAGKVALLK